MRSRSSAILMNFGLGAAPPEAYIQIAPGKKIAPSWEKIMAPGKTLHLGKKICGKARWAVGIGRCMVGYASSLQMYLLLLLVNVDLTNGIKQLLVNWVRFIQSQTYFDFR